MMTTRRLFLSTLLSSVAITGIAGAQTWSKSYSDGERAFLNNVIQLSNGDYFASGLSDPTNLFTPRGGLHRFDREGDHLAGFRIDGDEQIFVRDIEERHPDLVVAVGSYAGKPWLAEINAQTGQVLFQFRIADLPGYLESIDRTTDGGFVAVGRVTSSDRGTEMYVVRLDRFLSIEWLNRYGGHTNDDATSVTATADGGCVVVGYTTYSGDGYNQLMALSLAPNGDERWHRVYAHADEDFLRGAPFIDETPFGHLVIGWGEGRVQLIDSSGNVMVQNEYLAPGARIYDVLALSDGTIVFAGSVDGAGRDALIVKIALNGVILWQKALDSGSDESFQGLTEVESGAIVAVGGREGAPDAPFVARISRNGGVSETCGYVRDLDMTVSPLNPTPVTIDNRSYPVNISSGTTAYGHQVSVDTTHYCGNYSHMQFGQYGSGTSGSGGYVPKLLGSDGFCDGADTALEIQDGLGRSSGFLLIGLGDADVPFFGGRLYVDLAFPHIFSPIQLGGFPGQEGAGFLLARVEDDFTQHIGIRLYAQALLADPGGDNPISLTNGLEISIH